MGAARVGIAVVLGAVAALLLTVAVHSGHGRMEDAEKEMNSKKIAVHALSQTLAAKSEGPTAHVSAAEKADNAQVASEPWAPSTESQRLSPSDPRSKPSVFAWLWKASDPVPINTGVSTPQLAGNGSDVGSGGGANVTDAVSVEEASKENHDAAKKELQLSQDKEMKFFAYWTVAIFVLLGVGLISIRYARSILGGGSGMKHMPPQNRPPQGGEGGYGAVQG